MRKICGLLLGLVFSGVALAQLPPNSVDVANLREDVRGLTQRVSELALRVEQVEQENRELSGRAGAGEKAYVTLTQLNDAVTELNRTIRAADADTRSQILQQVASQMEKLAKQTNAAIESLAKSVGTKAPPTFSNDYPKEGVSYTVQKGETLETIAKKTGAKQQDIIDANKIPDPSKIMAGQKLFIPGGK